MESTRQLLRRLEAALDLYVQTQWQAQPRQLGVNWRQAHHDRPAYISAIALSLSTTQTPAMQIAAQMATWLTQVVHTHAQFILRVIPPGLLRVELTDAMIAARLQNLTLYPPNRVSVHANDTLSLFEVQYTHARCCSLLNLATRNRLIALEKPTDANSAAIFCVCANNAIAFVDAQGQLLCSHAAEQALIVQLFAVWDRFDSAIASSTFNWEKSAVRLSQAWQKFYADCRVWGEVQKNPQLVQARLGLTLVTQMSLRLLLNDKLGIFAPQEL